jgi:hypothetical protein
MNEDERDATMFAVDNKIGIERPNGVLLVDFGHPHDTCISERHRSVSIFFMQLRQSANVFLDAERDPERAIFEKLK